MLNVFRSTLLYLDKRACFVCSLEKRKEETTKQQRDRPDNKRRKREIEANHTISLSILYSHTCYFLFFFFLRIWKNENVNFLLSFSLYTTLEDLSSLFKMICINKIYFVLLWEKVFLRIVKTINNIKNIFRLSHQDETSKTNIFGFLLENICTIQLRRMFKKLFTLVLPTLCSNDINIGNEMYTICVCIHIYTK